MGNLDNAPPGVIHEKLKGSGWIDNDDIEDYWIYQHDTDFTMKIVNVAGSVRTGADIEFDLITIRKNGVSCAVIVKSENSDLPHEVLVRADINNDGIIDEQDRQFALDIAIPILDAFNAVI